MVRPIIEIAFPCSKCGSETICLIHTHEQYDETECWECGAKYKVYKPIIEEVK